MATLIHKPITLIEYIYQRAFQCIHQVTTGLLGNATTATAKCVRVSDSNSKMCQGFRQQQQNVSGFQTATAKCVRVSDSNSKICQGFRQQQQNVSGFQTATAKCVRVSDSNSKMCQGFRVLVLDKDVCVCGSVLQSQIPSTGLRHPSLEEGAGKRLSECASEPVLKIHCQ